MKRKLAIILASLATMIGGLAALPSAAEAYTFNGSCGWSTVRAWHWSPAYGVYYYYTGHALIGGLYYRLFYVQQPISGSVYQWVVYCG